MIYCGTIPSVYESATSSRCRNGHAIVAVDADRSGTAAALQMSILSLGIMVILHAQLAAFVSTSKVTGDIESRARIKQA